MVAREPDQQLAENLIIVFGFCKRTKKDKSIFVTKFVGIIGTIIFIKKFPAKFADKISIKQFIC